MTNNVTIHGTVEPGFESIKTLFEHNMRTFKERHTQLCIYVRGQKVVDLWGSAIDESGFSADSLVNIFSSGKSLESIAVGSLVGKGLLDFNDKVIKYWPEFGQAGKEQLTIADLMRHEAGLAGFDTSIEPLDLYRSSIKENKIGEIIEAQKQKFPKDTPREYHAATRGWIVNEVFRRIDPKGRTMGEFFEEEINTTLGTETLIGVSEEAYGRRVPVVPLSFKYQLLESLKPKSRRMMEHNIFQLIARLVSIIPNVRKGTTKGNPPPYVGMKNVAFFNKREVAMGETPSGAVSSSARSLAKIGAVMAGRGVWEGEQVIGASGWSAIHGAPKKASMIMGETDFTQGGVHRFQTSVDSSKTSQAFNGGREGFYGWMGLGGSIFQWHPEHEIGFAYVPTSLNMLDLFNERGKSYQAEVLKCLQQ